MKNALLLTTSIFILFLSACNTASDPLENKYVTLKILHGWCMPACETTFTVSSEKTIYIESNFQNDEGLTYEDKTKKEDWEKIEFYLETINYIDIETEPTCDRCADGNDYILIIQDGRFSNEIYYTWAPYIDGIENFDKDLREMRSEFLSQFSKAESE